MVIIKICLCGCVVLLVKMMFSFFYQNEDIKLYQMKEIKSFLDYLRIYSCTMKMSLSEIIQKYNFKYKSVENIFKKFKQLLQNDENGNMNIKVFENYVYDELGSPQEFNILLSELVSFYGISTAEVLDTKLSYTEKELEDYIKKYENTYQERKKLFNKLSLLVGSLIAIVLV